MVIVEDTLNWLKDNYQFFVTISISLTALAVSIVSLQRTNKIQKYEEIIKKYEAEKIENEKNKHLVEARFVNYHDKGRYSLKIWNSGNYVAKNVDIKCNPKIDFYDKREIMPLEELQPDKNIELHFSSYMGMSLKYKVKIEWIDENDNHHSNEMLLIRQ